MSDQQEVTIGEVYRLCQRIESQTTKTNGRVNALEDRVDELERDKIRFKAYWTAGTVGSVAGWELTKDWIKRKLGGL